MVWQNGSKGCGVSSKGYGVSSKRYGNHPSLLGIELLNEPSAATVRLDTLVNYYKQGYEIVRKSSSSAYVIFCQRIGTADPIELFDSNFGFHNVVVDLHYYNLFDTYFSHLTPADNINFIYKTRQTQLQTLNAANGFLLFIGEWTNEWAASNASSPSEYREFGKAQLEVYGKASFGWSYWAIKNNQNHWDFEWNINNEYLSVENSDDDRQRSRRWILVGLLSLFFL